MLLSTFHYCCIIIRADATLYASYLLVSISCDYIFDSSSKNVAVMRQTGCKWWSIIKWISEKTFNIPFKFSISNECPTNLLQETQNLKISNMNLVHRSATIKYWYYNIGLFWTILNISSLVEECRLYVLTWVYFSIA